MIIFRCRHGVFSKYFGDSPPVCKNLCDVCKEKDAVKGRITELEFSHTRVKKQTNFDDCFGLAKYDNDAFDDDDSERYEFFRTQAEEERKKAEKDLIEQQFALRRSQKNHEVFNKSNGILRDFEKISWNFKTL